MMKVREDINKLIDAFRSESLYHGTQSSKDTLMDALNNGKVYLSDVDERGCCIRN